MAMETTRMADGGRQGEWFVPGGWATEAGGGSDLCGEDGRRRPAGMGRPGQEDGQ